MPDPVARFGRYEILDEIGRGAMGVVYRARDPFIDRIVAVKVVHAPGPDEAEAFRARFQQEARAAGGLAHPGIVTIYDVGETDDTRTPYIVMEYVAGRTLSAAVNDAQPPLSLDVRLDLIQQVAEALDHAHRAGIVHRDIKPANILVTPEGRAKIADFGVAKLRLTQSQMTIAGSMLGTPSYISPEQVDGRPADGRSDLFSLGVILYWFLTGRLPFDGDSTGEILFKVMTKQHALPSTINPALSRDFDRVVMRALAKNPDERYQSGQAMRDDLSALRGNAGRIEAPAAATPPAPTLVLPRRGTSTTSPGRSIATADVGPVGDIAKFLVQKTLQLLLLVVGLVVDFLPRLARGAAAGLHRAWVWTRSLQPVQQWIVFGVVILAMGGIGVSLGHSIVNTATLKLALSGSLESGKVTVWMDGRTIANGAVETRTSKLAGVLPRTEGSYYRVLRVPPGAHRIRVRVVGTNNPYDETRQVEATLRRQETYTLYMRCGRRWDSGILDLRLYRVGAGMASNQ